MVEKCNNRHVNLRILWNLDTWTIIVHFVNEQQVILDKCSYDRLWFLWNLKVATMVLEAYLVEYFPVKDTAHFTSCSNLYKVCKINNIPQMSGSNDYAYPPPVLNFDITYFTFQESIMDKIVYNFRKNHKQQLDQNLSWRLASDS